MRTFGAIFVEVGVDRDLGLLRLRRVVARYSAGRIINPRTARSQMTGGIIWGWGMAALEASRHEPTLGRWLAKNLANVALPVNADIPAVGPGSITMAGQVQGPGECRVFVADGTSAVRVVRPQGTLTFAPDQVEIVVR